MGGLAPSPAPLGPYASRLNERMQPDTAHIRSDALRILTVATIVMGFGLFEAFSGAPSGPSAVGTPSALILKMALIGHGLVAYFAILVVVLRLLPRETLEGRNLKQPFYGLIFLFLMVATLFIVNLLERAAPAFS